VADTKISALTAASAAALANEHAINEAGTSKKVTQQQILDSVDLLADAAALADANKLLVVQSGVAKDAALTALITYLQTKGMARPKRLNSQHSNSTTTGTKVTDLDMTLEAGTYTFDYRLIVRSSSAGVAPTFAFNFTGTAAPVRWWYQYADLSATLLAAIGTISHNVTTQTLGFGMSQSEDTEATTAANMGPTGGVQTTATDIMVKITGLIVVSVSGNLELWHASEAANATTVEVGSSLVVIQTA
jgi:hypothetical protein